MALAPSVKAYPLGLQRMAEVRAAAVRQNGQDLSVPAQLALAVEPKRTRVAPHTLDERYTRAAWLLPAELHQDRWTHATRDAYIAAAKGARPPRGEDFASGVAACLAHDGATPLVGRAPDAEIVPGRGGVVGLRPAVRPTLRERPASARGDASFGRAQLCQAQPGARGGAGTSVRDRKLWAMAGLGRAADPPAAGGARGPTGVLRFDCAFDHFPIDAPFPVRAPATLYYYLEDDSIQINLNKDPFAAREGGDGGGPNAYGDSRGRVLLKRACVLGADGSLALRLERDLNVGASVRIHGRAYEVTGCDASTRALLQKLHAHVPPDAPAPLSDKGGRARTGDEARRGVGVPLPNPQHGLAAFGLQGSRHLHTATAARAPLLAVERQ